MPVVYNEPLSFLQRLVEYMEYVDLLEKASDETDPVSRLQVCNSFFISKLSLNTSWLDSVTYSEWKIFNRQRIKVQV